MTELIELTQFDIEKYRKLKDTFTRRNKDKDGNEALEKIIKVLDINTEPNNTGELRQKIDALEIYVKILKILGIDLFKIGALPNPKDEQEKASLEQDFLMSLTELKRSLKVVEDETLELTEDIETFASDSLFLEFLPRGKFKEWTKALLNDRDPNLTESQINELIQAWGKSVGKFVEDARKKDDQPNKVKPGEPDTFARFFRIHSELENLYAELADTETFQSSR